MSKNNTKNMTEGSPLILIMQFALPLFLGNLFQQAYNMVDAMIVGQILGANALAGVGASSSVQFLIIGFCIGICAGFSIPVAQRFGAGDRKALRKYVFHSTVLSVIAAISLTLICSLACNGILNILHTPKDIYKDAYIYLLILFFGIPFTILYNMTAGLLRAVGNSRTPFIFLATSTVINIGLDLFCIVVLKWGVAGASIATVAAQALSGILCLIYILKKTTFILPEKEDMKLKSSYVLSLINMGLPMGLQYSITAVGSMVMQSANNSLGSIYVSGFTAGMKIKQFMMCPFDALATAVATFAGQNYGAGDVPRIKKGVRIGLTIGVLYGVFSGLILIFFGRPMTLLFISADSTEVLNASGRYLRAMGFFFWSLGLLCVSRMTTQGLGFSTLPILSGMIEMVARVLMSIFAVPKWGYSAICFTDQCAWVSACFYIIPVMIICIKKIEMRLNSDPDLLFAADKRS